MIKDTWAPSQYKGMGIPTLIRRHLYIETPPPPPPPECLTWKHTINSANNVSRISKPYKINQQCFQYCNLCSHCRRCNVMNKIPVLWVFVSYWEPVGSYLLIPRMTHRHSAVAPYFSASRFSIDGYCFIDRFSDNYLDCSTAFIKELNPRLGKPSMDFNVALKLICVTSYYTMRLRQNDHHFANDLFKCIFLNENVWFPIKMSLKFVPKGRINNIPALVQIMAWRQVIIWTNYV